MEKLVYTKRFFLNEKDTSLKSAKVIVPWLKELVNPKSVVDLGCGIGTFLCVFKELGISDCLGIDGDYVDRSLLSIPKEKFKAADLKKPLTLTREFDLAMSLEVGEHLPQQSAATLVESLVNCAPVVMFSAAIPFQGGTEHLNEQWPEFWVELFAKYDYTVVDCIRPKVWRNENVACWYAQNTLLFVEKTKLKNYPKLAEEQKYTDINQIAQVHPQIYLGSLLHQRQTLVQTLVPKNFPARYLVEGLKERVSGAIKKRLSFNGKSNGKKI